MKLESTKFQFNQLPYWSKPIDHKYEPTVKDVELFDQNGYDLTPLEQMYSQANSQPCRSHRANHHALKYEWFNSDATTSGAHINHALCFERKGYVGQARAQLQAFAKTNNLVYKIIKMKPKWGMDISIDYADSEGNVFEVLHWEWDGFDYDEVNAKKESIEPFLLSMDWNDAAKRMLTHKDEWHHLGFFEQSQWKTDFFGIDKERFKMVIWE